MEPTELHEPAILAIQSCKPTKFLSCESQSALLTKDLFSGAPVTAD